MFLILCFIGFKTNYYYFLLHDVLLLEAHYFSNNFICGILLIICETGIMY